MRELAKGTGSSLRAVIVNLEASPEIDVTCFEMLDRLRSELRESTIQLHFARVADPVRDLFERSGFRERLDGQLFRGVDSAVAAYCGAMRAKSAPSDLRIVVKHE
jgi:MFS superfamily sulfate permease-like transporter